MTIDLRRAMRAATALVRSEDLAGATKQIQQALSGQNSPRSHPASTDFTGTRHGDGDQLAELTSPDPARPRLTERLRLPLGEVISTLRGSKPRTAWPDKVGKPNRLAEVPEGAQFLLQGYSGATGMREFKVYVPSSKRPKPALVLMLHGCTQDADDFAAGTRMNQLAEEFGFVVAYPIQPRIQNPSGCWNWFRPADQRRGVGEPSILAGIADQVASQYEVDVARIFVAGLSAGGAMAAVVAATYPEKFAAVGIHSGLVHGAAHDVVSAFAAMRGHIDAAKSQPRASVVPTIVFHGDADATVHPANADRIVQANSASGGSAPETSIGEAGGRRFTRRVWQATNQAVRLESWLVHGAGHAWSGGCTQGTFTDEGGPDASREMARFFNLVEASSIV